MAAIEASVVQRDCVVIGGGPAGSTFASLVRKHAPQLTVTVLERCHFPRWHIGESLIPASNGVLREIEVYDHLANTLPIRKIGIVFVWGADRAPWNADFLTLDQVKLNGTGQKDIIDVTGQDLSALTEDRRKPGPWVSFNVRRAQFDHRLLRQTREFGAEVREGTRGTEVLRDGEGRIAGVSWMDDAGNSGVIETPFVFDASGLANFLTRGAREYDPDMNNFAVYGYLSGAEWKVTYSGTREYTTVFVASVEKGWIWYFPIDHDVMSVGVVTNTRHFRDRLRSVDLEAFFWETLRSSPEVAGLVKNARLRTDVLPEGRRVACSRDWSSWARNFVGEGWAAAGDAAVFIDPILSTGLTLALLTSHRAAYTYLTAHADPALDQRALWQAYAHHVRGEAGSFLKLARYFYGNNRSTDSWWWEAQRLVNAKGRLDLKDVQAFTMATAGFFPTPRTNSPEVVASLIGHLSGARADIHGVYREPGVPPSDVLRDCRTRVLAPFRLDVRTQPPVQPGTGRLEVYHDLVTDDPEFAHRLDAVPCRIPPVLAPVVAAMSAGDQDVATLVERAPGLLADGYADPDAIRRSTLAIVRVAALKGLVAIDGG